MPKERKLEEDYKKLDKEDIEKEKEDIEKKIKDKKHQLLKFRLTKIRYDIYYTLVVSIILGFILWAWEPLLFSAWKALALGLAWFLLFEELHLHKMFKKE